MNILIRHYFHIDPDQLSAEQWTERSSDVAWLIEFEKNRMASVANKIFGKA